ncbi:recombinase family protein [Acidobacteria bacterium AH-259-D05]|nr:recombinase family protein [Acidobacteria bacterium AH-259-D05]
METIKNQKLIAACLLRVSGKKQRDNYSIPYQADVFLEEIKKHGFEGNIKHLKDISERYQDEHQIRNFRGEPLVYVEDGVSVTSFKENRSEEFSRMISDAKDKQYNVLFAIKVDRMARDQEQALGMVRILNKENGIRVIIPEDRTDTNDTYWKDEYELRAWLASREGRQIKFRMEFGRKRKMKEKRRVGDWPFGYTPIKDEKSKFTGFLEKNQEQVYWVTEIFRWYVFEGLSATRIADRLNGKGVPTRHGKKWSRGAVLTILHNETYTGRQDRKHLADKYDTDIPDFRCPPIISKELFETAKKKREENSRELRRMPKRDYLFRNKVFCRNCGGKLYGGARRRYGKVEIRYRVPDPKRRCIDGKPCGVIHENTLIAHVIPSVMRLCIMPEVCERMFKDGKSRDEETRNKIKDEEKIIEKIREDLKRNEYGFFHKIISESTAREIKRKLEPQLELHQKNIEELNQKLLSEEERRQIKRRLIHCSLSLNHKSGREFTEQLISTTLSLLDDLYVDCRRKEVLVSLKIPEFSHNIKLSNPPIDNEKFFKRPAVGRILDKAYVLYQAYKHNGNGSDLLQTKSFVIAQSPKNHRSITNQNTQPVKYIFRVAYGKPDPENNKKKAA